MHHDPAITWVGLIPGLNTLPEHVANAILVALIIVIMVLVGTRKIRNGNLEDLIIPKAGFTLQNFLETIVEAILKLITDSLGSHVARNFLMVIGGGVFFILFSNLAGLVPGFNPPTGNLNTTVACALTVFCMTHYFGWKEHGVKYLKQFVGPFPWLAPLMLPIEIIGHLARPMSWETIWCSPSSSCWPPFWSRYRTLSWACSWRSFKPLFSLCSRWPISRGRSHTTTKPRRNPIHRQTLVSQQIEIPGFNK